MRRASVLSGSAFRTAILFLLVFVVVLGAAGFVILDTTRASMDGQIRSSIIEDVELLRDANVTGGQQELLRFIRDAVATRSDKQFDFGLFSLSGRRIAGNITSKPPFRGWGTLAREATQDQDDPQFVGYAEKLGDTLVVVGRSQRFVQTVSSVSLLALSFAGCVICGSALLIGYLVSRGVSSKLQVIDDTLGAVSRGNTEIRLPVGPSNDQIDHVSRQINAHLDRLSEFMALTRNTIVAIAHDLKSPLHRAYMLLQEAASTRDPRESDARLEQALTEMETLGGVLDTVLRISRIETSDDNSAFAAFAPAGLVADLAQTFEPVLEAAGQHLRYATAADSGPPIFGDRRMVQQMLVNLIENASRYGGPGATVELGVETAAGGAVISVADNGPGIPAARHEEVFQPFRRLDAERNSSGAGLGLALVRAVATRHHARVALSDNGPGLRVVVNFPAMRAPAQLSGSVRRVPANITAM